MLMVFGAMFASVGFTAQKANLAELYSHNINYAVIASEDPNNFTSKNLVDLTAKTSAYSVLNLSGAMLSIGMYPNEFDRTSDLLRDISYSSSILVVDQNDQLQDFGYELIYGNLPQGKQEMTITEASYDALVKYGTTLGRVDNFEQLNELDFKMTTINNNEPIETTVKIVGVVKPHININDFYDNNGKAKKINSHYVTTLKNTQSFMRIVSKSLVDEYVGNKYN